MRARVNAGIRKTKELPQAAIFLRFPRAYLLARLNHLNLIATFTFKFGCPVRQMLISHHFKRSRAATRQGFREDDHTFNNGH
jgi:hypothetical protein